MLVANSIFAVQGCIDGSWKAIDNGFKFVSEKLGMNKVFVAVENPLVVRKAMHDWRSNFSRDAEPISGLGANTFWIARLGFWGHFLEFKKDNGHYRYWNPFESSRLISART
ncbi:hypothetical protein AB8Z38_23505 [Bradyrhizobium sp. LLZ17]|uniref:Uncharacterized protein n=1 Tax=Bradyrhizobium sp. LLZ17 TaxID=3239388 RepID=A0AB39XDX0_9BRAD